MEKHKLQSIKSSRSVIQVSFDYSRLPRNYPRRFLPSSIDLADWSQLESVFSNLQNRRIDTKDDLEKWIRDSSEFSAALFEEYEVRYIRMTSQTDDAEREKAYLYYVETIQPKVKPKSFNLDHKYLQSPARKQLPQDRYLVLDRKVANGVALFRQENVELEKEEAKLTQQYQKIGGALTVLYDGQERTMAEMARYLEEPKRDVRQEAWRLVQERRLKDRQMISRLYNELIALRQRIAKNTGFENYRDYAFRMREKFDYGPQDCFRFHDAVEDHIVPLVRDLDKHRANRLGIDVPRPWDLGIFARVDAECRPPLRPFQTTAELIQGCNKIFEQMDPQFGRDFHRMAELGLLDLESRRGKAQIGYCFELSEIRLPFIFLNTAGLDNDMRELLHESGHAFHTFATGEKDLHFLYRGENVPTEFAEVASMTMELLGGEHIEGTVYNHEDALRSRHEHLETVARLLAWVATIDAFQHWIYTNPEHSVEEREEFWVKLHERFGGIESWDGYEDALRSFWQRQGHLFMSPFYYIEYGIAQLGALGIWTRYRKDPREAVEGYKRALALGGSRPLPELFGAADLPFGFGPKTVESCSRELRAELILN